MKKFEVVQTIFKQLSGKPLYEWFQPKKKGGIAYAPTNIALCKYWGKRDAELNLPFTSSLSIALPDKGALTQLTVHEYDRDVVLLNDHELIPDSEFVKRIVQFLDLFRPEQSWHLNINIKMNIPAAAGLASSASGFASLTSALNDLCEWKLEKPTLSILARLGSGSAARSLWNGFVEWHAGVDSDGMDSHGEPLDFEWRALHVGILTVSEEAKLISSREAMQRTVNSSPFYANWPKKAMQDLLLLKQALQTKNFSLLGGVAESNALSMHATMLSSWPPVCYFLPETIALMWKVWALRKEGLEIYFTEDAGPNLKLLLLEKDKEAVKSAFPAIELIKLFESE